MKIILLTLLVMLAIGGIPYLIGWIEWKIKYPIISDIPPMRILSRGDYVTFENGRRFKFDGRDINLDFVFEDIDTLMEHHITKEKVLVSICTVSSRYGLKWRKPIEQKKKMTNKEDIAFRKLSMLMKAVTEANEQDDTLEELKAAAFEVLRLNPGCEQSDWVKILVEQYGTEVVDAYGKDQAETYASLEALWESPYLDKVSGLEYDFKTWAEAFSTDAAVQMYYDLTEKNE